MTKNLDIKKCYLCGDANFRKRRGKVRDNPALDVMECTSCGLVFLSSFSHICQDFYESSLMHDAETGIDEWIRETAWDDERRFDFLARFMENKSVLDFGCGNGGFLLRARNVASAAAGVELEARLKTLFLKKGLKVFSSLDEADDDYHIITLFHVLEHLPDPVGLLRQLSQKLKPGGSIIVEVPSADDVLLSLYESDAFSLFTYWSCHLFLFTERTIRPVAERAGLHVDYVKQVQRYPLSNHLYWLSKGKPGGHQKWGFLDSHDLRVAYEKQLASIGGCDTIMACFSRKDDR
jgi:2-polyprenyl-3-methyl-5-hydroxy-6-metoxy-1,4-benzoquinol methylase